MRKAGKMYADFKRMTTGIKQGMKSGIDERMAELRGTADLAKKSAMWDVNQPAEASPKPQEKPVSASMADYEPAAPPREAAEAQPPDGNGAAPPFVTRT